jgi:putative exporter of polyketide antibiotics
VATPFVTWRDRRLWLAAALSLAWGGLAHWSTPVRYQYIDPGSGALLTQLIASFIVGLLFYLRSVRRFFSGLIARALKRDQKSTPKIDG